jgi:hypothetical protein
MTVEEKIAWYDALVRVREKFEYDPNEDWFERIGEVLDDLWYSTTALQERTTELVSAYAD